MTTTAPIQVKLKYNPEQLETLIRDQFKVCATHPILHRGATVETTIFSNYSATNNLTISWIKKTEKVLIKHQGNVLKEINGNDPKKLYADVMEYLDSNIEFTF